MHIAAVLALSLLGVIWGAGIGLAANWEVVPNITARTEFNSNLNYDFVAPVSDFIFTLAPSATFNYTTEISQIQGKLGLTGLHYLSHGNFDHIDQDFEINGQYVPTDRWKLSLNTAYISDSTLVEEFLSSGLIMTRTPRQSILATPAVTYGLTERLAATVNYTVNRVLYQSTQFQSYTNQQVGLQLVQQLRNEKTSLIGNVVARYTQYPAEDTYRALGFYLGVNHKFSPEWQINLLGGVNVTSLDFHTQVLQLSQFPFTVQQQQATFKSTGADPYIRLSISRQWTKLYIIGGYMRDQNASAFGTISDSNNLFLNVNYNFTDRLSGSINGEYALSNQISQSNSLKSDYLNVGPQLTYKLTEEAALSPGYRFGLRDDITNKQTANSQIVWLMLTYTPLTVASEKRPTPAGTKPASTPGIPMPSGRYLTF